MSINIITKHVAKNQCANYFRISLRNVGREYTKPLSTCSCSVRQQHSLTSNVQNNSEKNSFLQAKTSPVVFNRRWYNLDSGPPSHKLPPLMNFPQIVWPSLIKSIRNFILATFIIKPYFDRDFNLPDFVKGAKKALEVVSVRMASGDVKSLEGLVAEDIVSDIQRSVSLMSLPQREQLSVELEDIYFSFPYQVGVIFNEEEGKNQKRFVEITMVFHALKGLAQMKARGEEPPMNMGLLPEYQKRISICNYRFIKEFTKGVESDWTINLLNHFKPSDQMEE